MKKNKFLIFLIISVLIPINSFAALQNKIIVKVEGLTISTYELKNKIKTTLILSNEIINQENINTNKDSAINFLINLRLKEQELSNYNIQIDNALLNTQLNQLTSNNLVNFKKKLINEDLSFEIFKKEIETELKWQRLIYSKFNDRVNTDISILEKDLKSSDLNNLDSIEYKLAEIEVLFTENLNKSEIINSIKKKINEIGFEKAAKQVSISSSAIDGGIIGWVNSTVLTKNISENLKNLKIGDISKPIINPNSILFLKIIDKKNNKAAIANKEEYKKELINTKKNQLLNLYSSSYLSKLKNNSSIEFR
jgi:peptidyl-prolyl cis-trans isomerase SurA